MQACLRVPTLTPEANGDDYYYHLLMLYLPWRWVSNNDCLLVLGGDQASFAAEVTCQLRALNQFGDTVYICPNSSWCSSTKYGDGKQRCWTRPNLL